MKDKSVLCFGGEDWWYHNRGHIDMQLMRRFATIATTLYINSIVMQKPVLTQPKKLVMKLTRKAKSVFTPLQQTDAGFWVHSPLSLPVHHIDWLRPLNTTILYRQICSIMHRLGMRNPIVWVACPAACSTAVKIKRSKLIYQRTDIYEEYPNVDRKTIINYDRQLKQKADLTIFANHSLYERESSQCKKAIYLDHGVDYQIFATAQDNGKIPADMKNISHPIAGFFGGIDGHTCDMPFIEKTVELLPHVNFVFIGQSSVDCTSLSARPNVKMLGKKPYEQIPHYGKFFDVAIMPWRQNRWIKACNPIKLKEYLALGKPVVSTPFPQLQNYHDIVYEAKTPDHFARCIKEAISQDRPELAEARRKKVQNASWETKAEAVIKELFEKDSHIKYNP